MSIKKRNNFKYDDDINVSECFELYEGLSEEEKVDLWASGDRKVNVKACSPDKLKRYYHIARGKGYTDICNAIVEVAKEKGIDIPEADLKTSDKSDEIKYDEKPTSSREGKKFRKLIIYDDEDDITSIEKIEDKPETAEKIEEPEVDIEKSDKKTYDSTLEELKDIAEAKAPKVVTSGMSAEEINNYQDSLYAELVPGSGKAATMAGEILSAWNYGLYRYFNDGDWFYGFGTTWNKSSKQCVAFLKENVGPGLGWAASHASNIDEFVKSGNSLILNIIFREKLYDKRCVIEWRDYDYK